MGIYHVFYNPTRKEYVDPGEITGARKIQHLVRDARVGSLLVHLLDSAHWDSVWLAGDEWDPRFLPVGAVSHEEITHDRVHPNEPSNGWRNVTLDAIRSFDENHGEWWTGN